MRSDDITISMGGGWDVKFHPIPSEDNYKSNTSSSSDRGIVLISIPLSTLFTNNEDAYHAFSNSRAAKIALADYTARVLSNLLPIHHEQHTNSDNTSTFTIQTMGQSKHSSNANNKGSSTKLYGRNKKKVFGTKKDTPIPYVLERSDCMIVSGSNNDVNEEGTISLQFYLHATMHNDECLELKKKVINDMLSPILHQLQVKLTSLECYTHVACVVLQNALRDMLHPPRQVDSSISTSTSALPDEKKADGQQVEYLNAVAFIADDSLLPRKSGRSSLPMSSPPAVPFYSPENSDQLTRVVTVNVGS